MMMMMMTMTWVFPVKGQWLWFSWNITTDFWRSSVLFSHITCLKFVFWNFSVYLCDTLTTAAPFIYMGSILKNKLVSIGFKKTSRSELFLSRKELSNERLQKMFVITVIRIRSGTCGIQTSHVSANVRWFCCPLKPAPCAPAEFIWWKPECEGDTVCFLCKQRVADSVRNLTTCWWCHRSQMNRCSLEWISCRRVDAGLCQHKNNGAVEKYFLRAFVFTNCGVESVPGFLEMWRKPGQLHNSRSPFLTRIEMDRIIAR